jgi:hypothetical protein
VGYDGWIAEAARDQYTTDSVAVRCSSDDVMMFGYVKCVDGQLNNASPGYTRRGLRSNVVTISYCCRCFAARRNIDNKKTESTMLPQAGNHIEMVTAHVLLFDWY